MGRAQAADAAARRRPARPRTSCSPSWPTPGPIPARRAAADLGQRAQPLPLDAVQGGAVVAPGAGRDHREPPQDAGPRADDAERVDDRAQQAEDDGPRGPGRASARRSTTTRPPSSTALVEQLTRDRRRAPVGHPGAWCSPSASPRSTGWPQTVPAAAEAEGRADPGPPRRSGRREADGRDRGVRPGRVAGAAAVHRRHGVGGREPPPPVPSPHPLRPALVAHHHRAAQRPHRPLRPAAVPRRPGPATEAQPRRSATATSGCSPSCSSGSTRPTGPSATRARCSGSTTSKLEEEAIAKKLARGRRPRRGRPRPSRPRTFDLMTLIGGHTGHDPIPEYESPTLFGDETALRRRGAGRRLRRSRHRAGPPPRGRPSRAVLAGAPARPGEAVLGAAPQLHDRAEGRRAAACSPATASEAQRHLDGPGRRTDSQLAQGRAPVAAASVRRLAGRQGARRGRPQRGTGHRGRRRRPHLLRAGALLQRPGPAPAGRVDGGDRGGGPDGGRRPVRRAAQGRSRARHAEPGPSDRLRPARGRRCRPRSKRPGPSWPIAVRRTTPSSTSCWPRRPSGSTSWVADSHQLAFASSTSDAAGTATSTPGEVRNDTEALIESMRIVGQPLIRVVAVLAPKGSA